MGTMVMMVEAAGEAIGSLIAAWLLCWLLWDMFKLIRHPAWAALAVLLILALGLTFKLPKSELLRMALTFATIGALPLWIAGREWRKSYLENLTGTQRSVAGEWH